MGIKQRFGFADYLDVSVTSTPAFELMGAGFTKIDESPSAQTSSKRYVHNRSTTKSVTGYDDSFSFEGDLIESEKAVEFLQKIGEERLTGAKAESTYVRVNLDKKVGDSGSVYEARKFSVAIEISDFSDSDGEMTFSGNLLPKGDPAVGKFDTSTKTFTEVVPT